MKIVIAVILLSFFGCMGTKPSGKAIINKICKDRGHYSQNIHKKFYDTLYEVLDTDSASYELAIDRVDEYGTCLRCGQKFYRRVRTDTVKTKI